MRTSILYHRAVCAAPGAVLPSLVATGTGAQAGAKSTTATATARPRRVPTPWRCFIAICSSQPGLPCPLPASQPSRRKKSVALTYTSLFCPCPRGVALLLTVPVPSHYPTLCAVLLLCVCVERETAHPADQTKNMQMLRSGVCPSGWCMGGLFSWLRGPDADPWATAAPGSVPAISEVLAECWGPLGMPEEVITLIMSFYCFEGKLASMKALTEEIKYIVCLSNVFVTSTCESLTCWKGLRAVCSRRVSHRCVAHLEDIVWCGGGDGSLILFDPEDFQCLRHVRGHKVAVGALVVSSDARKVLSYPAATGDFIRVWNPRGLPIHTLQEPSMNVIQVLDLRLVVSADETWLTLWDGGEQVWEGQAKDLETQPAQPSSFTVSNSNSPILEEGATVIATRTPQLNNQCTISTHAQQVHLCDRKGRPTRPIWNLPANTSVYAAGVFRDRVILSTSDHVMYVYE
eukprot:TRINITY_DN3086_c0_g1_i1.p1 TRINITY_DN3086_c0_g1~~TRINITY_DN3086_c0_g1_i1.p1  ORF type:complete len:459 (+),score=44.21 TRINITY_DN3086_c0_g1_i1:229-1605(+)